MIPTAVALVTNSKSVSMIFLLTMDRIVLLGGLQEKLKTGNYKAENAECIDYGTGRPASALIQ